MSRIALPNSTDDIPFNQALSTYGSDLSNAAVNFTISAYQNSLLSWRELEGARYRTALINGCHVCKAARGLDASQILEASGGDISKSPFARGDAPDTSFYDAIPNWRESTIFSDRERIAIEMAERMGQSPHSMEGDDDFWQRVHDHFSDKEIFDMTLTISSWISMGRVVHTLELDSVCHF